MKPTWAPAVSHKCTFCVFELGFFRVFAFKEFERAILWRLLFFEPKKSIFNNLVDFLVDFVVSMLEPAGGCVPRFGFRKLGSPFVGIAQADTMRSQPAGFGGSGVLATK